MVKNLEKNVVDNKIIRYVSDALHLNIFYIDGNNINYVGGDFIVFKKMIFIKNEKNIYPRLLEGLMDTHSFFEKNIPNNMCSYVNDWSMIDILLFRLREIIYVILFYIFRVGLRIDNLLPETWKNDTFIQQHISVFKYIWRDIMLYLTV